MHVGMAYYISINDLIGEHYYTHMYIQLYTSEGNIKLLSLQVIYQLLFTKALMLKSTTFLTGILSFKKIQFPQQQLGMKSNSKPHMYLFSLNWFEEYQSDVLVYSPKMMQCTVNTVDFSLVWKEED